jgi:hypothetical protein
LSKSHESIHGGLAKAGRWLLSRVSSLLIDVFVKAGYDVEVIGHSMGAGVAAVACAILREEYDVKAHCFAFAPPPALGRELAEKSMEYIVSCVHNDDVIPRTGIKQLKTFVYILVKLKEIYDLNGKNWALVEKHLDSIAWSEIERRVSEMYTEKRFDSVVPGKVVLLISRPNSKLVDVVLVSGQIPTLRQPVCSRTMVSDHSMEEYIRALGASNDTAIDATRQDPSASVHVPSAMEKWTGMRADALQSLKDSFTFG